MKLTTYENPLVLLMAGLIACAASAGESASVTVPGNATSQEIQQALDSLPEAGGEVILPAGTFAVLRPISLKRSHQTLRGSGVSTVLRLADRANCPVIVLGEPVNQPKSTISDLKVADLVIDGNRRQQEFETWQNGEGSEIRNNGITVQGVTDSAIQHVTTAHCRSGGLVTTHYVRRLTVREFSALDSEFDGLACYRTEESQFSGLFLHDNQAAGISFDQAVSNNVISGAVLAGNDLGIFMRDARYNVFKEVHVDKSRSYGVFIAQSEAQTPTGWRLMDHTEATNNSFIGLQVTQCGGAAFRVNDPTCVDNVISSGRFHDNVQGVSVAAPNLVTVQTLEQE